MVKRRYSYAEQKPEKQMKKKKPKNKRIVFSEDVPGPAPKRQKTQSAVSFTFHDIFFHRQPYFWPNLQIRGPFLKILPFLDAKLVTNRPVFHFIRHICLVVHENFLIYQQNELPKLRMQKTPGLEEIVQIVEKMCQKTMKMTGGSIILNVDPIFPCFHKFFSLPREGKLVKVDFDEFSDLLQQFRLLFHEFNISESELISIRNVFIQFFIEVSIDLITTTLFINYDRKVHGFRKTTCFFNDVYFDGGSFEDLVRFSYVAKIGVASAQRVANPRTVSLWLLVPCTGRQHLLEHVFEDGLLQILPENVKEFLTVWMVSVRNRMRKLLKNGELKSTAERIFDVENRRKKMELNDEKVEEFLVEICQKVMNSTEDFEVFGQKWTKCVMKNISLKNDKTAWNGIWSMSHCKAPATKQLTALFSDTKSDSSLLAHLLFQLLCFFIRFSFHTIRHVFKFSINDKSLIYDGKLEVGITDFKKIIEYEKEKAKESTPVHLINAQNPLEAPKTPLVHVIRPRKTLLPTPTLEGVPAVRVPRPELYPNMPPHHCVPLPQNYSISPSSEPKIKLEPAFSAKKGFIFTPMPASPLSLPSIASKREPSEPNLSCEVTEEELKSARALRTPSEVSGSLLNRLNDDEDLPKKWLDAYKLTLEWNQDLKSELERVKQRFEKL